ncbi:folylpolyglutamate synthase/dihydrofolate synthase family protein [Candidatus Oleimmundimicrobium sp.]|uniref:bifunctional folylpolyglutamate synthase/dihydrofolate synthase n=1 Tax=Candidatus Oleimmundimicrobium sp. TaxID=3060597 RepID=UPI00271911FF|nr:folylpolyglutamate synthase/dihydrofolate synthase family protein [Candidatus Oleimmundimicrobium sp.]MDO8886126.1 folylpolyglutamate synthase/dihydrofolate synthase family protein [Candidatus Oleimmundimicrobium sp.]
MQMNFTEANDYINSLGRNEINPGLKRIEALCGEIENPQNNFSVIQITGTNGKTSTARITASLLNAHGIRTGTYTSPHLSSITERFEIDGEQISKKDFSDALTLIMPGINKVNERFSPDKLSYFEVVTALALIIFKKKNVKCAVLEVGMGGRWDATSISNPKVSVITNVELDHTDRLGDTVSQIAWEKAHIIKSGSTAIVGELSVESLKIVKKRCVSEGVDLKVFNKDFFLINENMNKFSINGIYGHYNNLSLNLLGRNQLKNACLAVVASEAFLKGPLSTERTREGLDKVKCPGRLEVISQKPLILLDGAHNPAGAKELAYALKNNFVYDKLIIVIAILKDKDVKGIIDELIPITSFAVLTENKNERCAPCDFLRDYIGDIGYDCVKNIPDSLQIALKKAGASDLICVTGSLSTIAEAREFLLRKCRRNFEGKKGKLSKHN